MRTANLYPLTEQECPPMLEEVQWRERLMTRMVQAHEFQAAMGEIGTAIRNGEPQSIRAARSRLAALQTQLSRFDRDLAMIQEDAQTREEATNAALGIDPAPEVLTGLNPQGDRLLLSAIASATIDPDNLPSPDEPGSLRVDWPENGSARHGVPSDGHPLYIGNERHNRPANDAARELEARG